ncbi:hypothetical protein IAQ61_000900 [Plenodomus lingam]|uniref:Uncharacterized protein n=1 Tax=Leptosphaeria maculans (strain JN3 / isolate v23.1.3 / race Av1-4-5-6-7-8) TaxID=985895 RepID=E5A2X5_LEPMJ|nr:hypothetical protein LEMA_P093300.1 [Plenodomus lingam JN3]KAH9880606.1 hypothetical protein IAQ61_000900 [Plenodomus lingam]CBX97921.1 hypothetical protein LEMA_P093300.1 [Plenodomus lingam JN3]
MSRNPNAQIVNLSSAASALAFYSTALQAQFRAVETVSDIDTLASSYLEAVRGGDKSQEESGWGTGPRSYSVSKACVNALTVVLARLYPGVCVNCCCPGWMDTDMGRQGPLPGDPAKTVEEGARIPVRFAVGDLSAGNDEDGGVGREGEG